MNAPSELRQMIDVIGAEITSPQPDPVVVMKCCQNIAFAARDKKPLPDDVFQPGINDALMRITLSSLCLAVINIIGRRKVVPGA